MGRLNVHFFKDYPEPVSVGMVPFFVAHVGRGLWYSISSQTWVAAYRTMTRQRKHVYT